MMFKKWSGKSPPTSCSIINLNTVNSSLQVINSPITSTTTTSSSFQMNRPSLLRRSRGSGPPNNPLLNHFLLGLDETVKLTNPTPAFAAISDASSGNDRILTTTATLQHTSASDLPPVSAMLRRAQPPPQQLEEVIIWQPETSECEIVEVEPGDLARYLAEKREPGGLDIQEIIVCAENPEEGAYDEVDGGEVFGNYVVQVFQESPEEEVEECEDTNPTPPLPIVKIRKSRPKKLISLIPTTSDGDGNFVVDESMMSVPPPPKKRKTLVDIKCLEPDCDVVVHSVHDLRFHLQEGHGMSFHEEQIHFESQELFKRWRTAYEQMHKVSFIYRGGTKKISAEKAVTYLICHRSGIYKPTMTESHERKRKMKPQGSCKIGTHCTAGIKLVKYLSTTAMDATVCHTHYGHDLNNQHLRLTSAIKERVLQKFNEGRSFPEVLQYIHHNPDGIDGLRLVDRRAIRNIYDQWRKVNAPSSSLPLVTIENSAPGEVSQEPLLVAVEFHQDESVDHVKSDQGPCSESESCHMSTQENEIDDDKPRVTTGMTTRKRSGKNGQGRKSRRKSVPTSSSIKSTVIKEEGLEPCPLDPIVARLLAHGDSGSGPTVLLYKKGGEPKPEIGDMSRSPMSPMPLDSMCLILQTPIQRQLLSEFSRVIHLELVEGTDITILVVVVVDSFLMAIPVAWMITNSPTDTLVEIFFRNLALNSPRGINCEYLFGTRKGGLHEIWDKVFTPTPIALYPQEDVFRELKLFLRKYYDDVVSRGKVYDILEKMVLTPEKGKFDQGLLKLHQIAKNSNFLKVFQSSWVERQSRWAFHTRTQIHPALEDSFGKLRKFILFKGTKSLDRNIGDILKIGYDKCFQHDKNLVKGDIKRSTQLDNYREKHCQSSKSNWDIQRSPGSTLKYRVNGEFDVFDLRAICDCRIRCSACDMCVHQLMCSCGDSQFCVHVHAVKAFLEVNPEANDPSEEVNDPSFTSRSGNHLKTDETESKLGDFSQVMWIEESAPFGSGGDADDGEIQEEPEENCSETPQDENPGEQNAEQVSLKMESVGPDEVDPPHDVRNAVTDPGSTKTTTISIAACRTSTRLQQKRIARGRSFLPIPAGGGGGGGGKGKLKRCPGQRSLEIPFAVEGPSKGHAKEKETGGEQEDLRDEMLRLINQIEEIQDPKLLNQVKKKVTSLSNLLQK